MGEGPNPAVSTFGTTEKHTVPNFVLGVPTPLAIRGEGKNINPAWLQVS